MLRYSGGSGSSGTAECSAKATVSAKTANYNLLTTDSGLDQTFTMNNAAERTFTLPSVVAGDVGTSYVLAKIGAGKVIIDASDSDTIGGSSAGGTVYDDEAGETYATITLQLISATQWAILGYHGTWVTT